MRYLVFFNGQSQGADGDSSPSQVVPTVVVPDWDARPALANLQPLTAQHTILSALQPPTSRATRPLLAPAGTCASPRPGGHCPPSVPHLHLGRAYPSLSLGRVRRRHGALGSMGSASDCFHHALS